MEANPRVEEKLIDAGKRLDNQKLTPPHETLDAKRHSRPRIRVQKMSYKKNPLKQGMVFQIHGAAYMVYEVKSRGRMLVRLMGEVIQEKEPEITSEGEAKAIKEGEDEEV